MRKYRRNSDIFFYILIPSWNSFHYFDRCIDSVLFQSYKNYQILFIDDCSEYTTEQKQHINTKLRGHIVKFNNERHFAVRNIYEMIHTYAEIDEAIIVNLDGDDWLLHREVVGYLASIYKNYDCLLTYGDCLLWDGKKISEKPASSIRGFTNISYKRSVVEKTSYRHELFYPLHPRTWKAWLYKNIKEEDFKEADGTWLKFCPDMAMFFPMLEMVHGRYKVLEKVLYVYNIASKHNVIKKNPYEMVREELIIRRKTHYEPLV